MLPAASLALFASAAAAAVAIAAVPAALAKRSPVDAANAVVVANGNSSRTTTSSSSSSTLAPLEQSGSNILLGAWYDRPNGDTPLAINNRLGYKLSFFQTDIDLTGTVKPVTGPNITTQYMQHLDATDSSALAYLTVYPFNGFAAVTDAQLADLLTRIKAIIASGRPVFFRYASEMNGNWFLYGQDPAGFKASWIRVYNYIKGGLGADANKIAFLWSPNSGYNYPWPGGIVYPNATNPADAARIKLLDTDGDGHLTGADNPFTPYYPGDQYVDWVGLSMYHYGTEWPWYQNVPPKSGDFEAFLTGTYMTDTGLFPFYTWFSGSGLAGITSGNKPFFVSETGAAYHYGWDPAKQPIDPAYINQLNTTAPRTPIKQSWWRQFLSPDFLSRYPRVRAICTFEFDKAEELTLRDFSNMGVAPGGQAEAADVLAALQADLAGDYGSAVAWASAGMPVRVEATSSPVASATVAPVNKTSAAAGVDAARVVERVAAVAVGLLGLALAALVA